jgi:hypothetical protein
VGTRQSDLLYLGVPYISTSATGSVTAALTVTTTLFHRREGGIIDRMETQLRDAFGEENINLRDATHNDTIIEGVCVCSGGVCVCVWIYILTAPHQFRRHSQILHSVRYVCGGRGVGYVKRALSVTSPVPFELGGGVPLLHVQYATPAWILRQEKISLSLQLPLHFSVSLLICPRPPFRSCPSVSTVWCRASRLCAQMGRTPP